MIKRFKNKSLESVEKLALKTTRFIGSTKSLIIHTILFIVSFTLYFFHVSIDKILLVVTTILSLEAIYLSIFIQMSVNHQNEKLTAVALDIDEIQEDVEEIEKDIDEIQEDVEEIQEDDKEDEEIEKKDDEMLTRIEDTLGKLIEEVLELKKENKVKKEAEVKMTQKVIELKKENEKQKSKKKRSIKKSNK